MTTFPEDVYLHGLRINAEGNGRFQVCFDQHDMHGPTGRWYVLARNFETQQSAADFIAQIANRIHAYDVRQLAEAEAEHDKLRRSIERIADAMSELVGAAPLQALEMCGLEDVATKLAQFRDEWAAMKADAEKRA